MPKRNQPCTHGLIGRCNACRRLAYQASDNEKNKARERARRWSAEHPERARARANEWHAAHPGEVRANIKAWKGRHPDRVRSMKAAWRASNPVKARGQRQRAHYIAEYGITYAEAVAMREAQGNRCAICGGEMGEDERSATRWVVDHYDTPAGPVVRGILHNRCNAALGLMNDHDPQALRNAADYIERHGRAVRMEVQSPSPSAEEAQPQPQLALRLVKEEG